MHVNKKGTDELIVSVPKYPFENARQYPLGDDRFWSKHTIRYVYRELKYGFRPYFVCPVTGDDCLKLVFYRGLVSSIPAYNQIKTDATLSRRAIRYETQRSRLLNLDGTSRGTDVERETLTTFLRSNPSSLKQDENVLAYLERARKKKERERAKWLRQGQPLSTTKGLDTGRGAFQHAAFDEYGSLPLEWIESIPPVGRTGALPLPDNIGNYGELDIRVLIKRSLFDLPEGRISGRTLGWPSEMIGNHTIYLFIDARFDDKVPSLIARIRNDLEDSVVWQTIRLLQTPRSEKVRYMVCPLTHIRCDILYFRDGFFASREAHGLYLSSQRAAGRIAKNESGP